MSATLSAEPTLTESIEKAINDIKLPTEGTPKETDSGSSKDENSQGDGDSENKEVTGKDATTGKTDPAKTVEESQEDKELAVQGKQLMLALKDPERASVVIRFLAEQAGYTKVETKQEAKEVKNEVLDTLKESLGTEFDFLADKLAPAISKIVDASLKKNTEDIRKELQDQKTEKLQTQSENAINALAKEFFNAAEFPKEVNDDMAKFMEKYAPSPNDGVKEYIKDIFDMVVQKRGLVKVKTSSQSTGDRLDKNRNDVASRLTTSGGNATEPSGKVVNPKNPMTLDEAVKAAILETNKKKA